MDDVAQRLAAARRRFEIQMETPFWRQVIRDLVQPGCMISVALGDETVVSVGQRIVAYRSSAVAVAESGRDELTVLTAEITPIADGISQVRITLPGCGSVEIAADGGDQIGDMIEAARRLQSSEE